MIYTNTEDVKEVKKMGVEFKKAVNAKYRLLEIEMDGMFRRMLLLKKKKYAALVAEERANGELKTWVETKGLDMVRRDWCGLSKDVSETVLNRLLLDNESQEVTLNHIHAYLEQVGKETREGLIPVDKYVINKQLTKAARDYHDAGSQPHVQVAKRMEARGQAVRVGETVPYVICLEPGQETSAKSKGYAERAYHPDDVKKDDSELSIDVEWYLSNQILGPVTRLCAPIEGTSSARIAECLGLDAAKFKAVTGAYEVSLDVTSLGAQITDEERFKNVDKWLPACYHCDSTAEFELIRDVRMHWHH